MRHEHKEPIHLLTIAAMSTALACLGFGDLIPHWSEILIRLSLFAATTIILAVYVRRWHSERLRARPPRLPRHTVPFKSVNGLRRRAGSNALFKPDELLIFAGAVAIPSEFRQRVADTYTPSRRTLHQTVSIECQIPKQYLEEGLAPDRQGRPIYFPLLIPRKGQFADSFNATASNGSSLSILSYSEYLQLVACTLRLLLLTAYTCKRVSDLPEVVIQAESVALRKIVERAVPAVDARVEGRSFNPISVLVRIETERRPALLLAESLVEKLTDSYALVAAIHPDRSGRFLVTYEQTLIPDLEIPTGPHGLLSWARQIRWLRFALGAGPVNLTVGIENACTCRSYHLHVNGTEGLYVIRQTPLDMAATIKARAIAAPTPPHMRFRKRLGQPYAHFYARYFPESQNNEQPRIKFKFAEVPPGSLFRALIVAVAGLVVTWFAGVVPTRTVGSGADALAVLLVVPALGAAWLGFESSIPRLLEGTLRAKLSLMLTVFGSIASTGLYLAHQKMALDWWKLPDNLSFLGVVEVPWLVLVGVAVANCVYVAYKYALHTYEYAYYSTREGSGDIAVD